MPQILIRQLSEETHHALKARAHQSKKSAEALAREILEASLNPDETKGFGDELSKIWQDADLSDIEIVQDKTPFEAIDLI